MILTVNGKAEIVVQDANSYQELLDRIDRLEAMVGIQKGLADVKNGQTQSLDSFITEMETKHDISYQVKLTTYAKGEIESAYLWHKRYDSSYADSWFRGLMNTIATLPEKPLRCALSPETDDPKNPKGAPYASDYPDCLNIVEELVKPERDKLGEKKDSSAKGYAKFWWQYGRKGKELYEAIKECDRVLVIAATSRTLAFAFEVSNIVFSHATIVLAFNKYMDFAILQGIFHECWARKYASSMKGDYVILLQMFLKPFLFPSPLIPLPEKTYITTAITSTEREILPKN